ncbi:type IV pilin protein [Sphaerotilus sp.]|uniref:type IV pilin protein n=1 Tax=Sphaerotilus sp. TaxID=2093942 RepID=UPI0034E2E81F
MHPHWPAHQGMTLIELVIALVLVAIMATLAAPSWLGQIQRMRRSDAIVTLAQIQQAQERWRSQRPGYATGLGKDALDLPSVSPAGHYDVSTSVQPDTAQRDYRVTAIARGTQADDRLCRWLVLDVESGQLHHRSGPDEQAGNADTQNRQCWKS